MGVYDSLIKTADRLIDKYGMTVEWNKAEVESASEPGEPSSLTPGAEFQPRVAFFPPDGDTGRTLTALTGREAPQARQMGLLSGGCGFEVEHTDTVTKSGVKLPIIDFARIAPADIPVLFLVWFSE